MRRLFAASAVVAGVVLTPVAAHANDKAIIVIDASGSMWGQIDGRTKIEIARETLSGVLQAIPDTLDLGLVAYGHRQKGSCADIQEIVAPAPGTRGDIAAAVKALNPKGKTPIADSVKLAAKALKYTEDKATVIVVTDGIETCSADPCALASELERMGVDFTAHVIGFGLSDEEGKQVACLAENTGGRYLQAANAEELTGALTKTVAAAPAPEPEPLPAPEPAALAENLLLKATLGEGDDAELIDGLWEFFPVSGNAPAKKSAFRSYEMPLEDLVAPGRYLVRFSRDLVKVEEMLDVAADKVLERNFVLDAGKVRVSVAADESAEIDDSARFDIEVSGGKAGGYGKGEFIVPAGEVRLAARLGEAEVEETLVLAAGETVERKMIAAAGILGIEAVYTEGGPKLDDSGYRVDVLSAKADLQGKRESIAGGYGPGNAFKLAPGDYLVRVKMGAASAETPVSVKKGERADVVVSIDAGVFNVKAPGAYRIDILSAVKDLQGKRREIGGSYGEEFQMTAPPGDYVAVVTFTGDHDAPEKEMPLTVKAAERTEVTVE